MKCVARVDILISRLKLRFKIHIVRSVEVSSQVSLEINLRLKFESTLFKNQPESIVFNSIIFLTYKLDNKLKIKSNYLK